MEIEDAIFQWVSGLPALTAVIGSSPVRFFKGKIPQGSHMPAGVILRAGTGRQNRGCTIDGAVSVSLQIDWYAKTWQDMKEPAMLFRVALQPNVSSFPIYMGGADSPAEFVKVKAATCENEFDGDDPEPGLQRRTQLWTFWIFETT